MKNYILSFFLLITVSVFSQTAIVMSSASNNQTFNTCNGFIIDSGGQGGTGYSNGQNVTITICPDTPGEIVSIVFNFIALSNIDDNPAANVENVDYMDVYDGPSSAYPTLGTYTGNELQGVVINATALNTSGCITLRFRSNSVGTGQFTAIATCETPCATPFAGGIIAGGITTDSTVTCVGTPINFTNFGSSAQMGFNIVEYKWDFMDGNQAFGQNVTHSFDTPGQYLVQLFVTDDNGCGNTNLIDLQVLVATIPTFIGFPGDTTLCLGESASFSIDPNTYEILWNGFPSSVTFDDGCLPDTLLGVSQDVEIMQTGFAPGSTLQNINDVESLCFDLEHSFMGDLVILVQCPNGQTQILHQQGGGGTQLGVPVQLDNVDCSDPTTQGTPFTYCFTPTAPDTWVDWVNASGGFGLTLPAGDYAPIDPFSNLLGCPLNGIWSLTVIDNWAADDGTLFAFDINLNPALYPPVTTFQPQIGLGSDSSYWTMPAQFVTNISPYADAITINPTSAGSYPYTYTVIDNFGCTNDSSFVLTINDNPLPNAGNDITVCDGTAEQLNGSISGSGGGSPCPYVFDLGDSFGDGWNGNNLLVTVNGVTTPYTITTGNSAVFTVNIPHGASVSTQFQASGNYTTECDYTVTDPNGNIVIEQGQGFTAPPTTVETFTADCFGGFDFIWSPAADLNNANIPNPIGTFLSPQTLTLTVFPTGHPLCATTDQVNVTLSASANPGNDGFTQVCAQAAPVDLFPLLGAGASPNGIWTNPAGATIVMPYDPITMNPGMYTYTVDSNGCVSSAIITVSEINTTVSTTPTNVSCNSANNGSVSLTYTGGTNYILNGGASTPAPASPFVLNNLAPANYTIEIVGVSGCSDTSNFVITEPNPLAITFVSPDSMICSESTIDLSAVGTGGSTPNTYTFTWTENGIPIGNGSTINVDPINTGNIYCVTLSELCGSPIPPQQCLTITFPTPITPITVPDDSKKCLPGDFIFSNTSLNGSEIATMDYSFSNGFAFSTTNLNPLSAVFPYVGNYCVDLSVTSIYGCVYTSQIPICIEVTPIPIAGFTISKNPATWFETTIQTNDISVGNISSYVWSSVGASDITSNGNNAFISYPEGITGNYEIMLKVTDSEGCTDSTIMTMEIVPDIIFYTPNSFTPDDDEHNQSWIFYIEGIDFANFSLQIYNRWGEVIWETNDVKAQWDGCYNEIKVPAGSYPWKASFKAIDNDDKIQRTGLINVIR
jgi:gliding motility-associated-like protein